MIIANRYEVVRELGRGGMANVYLALDKILNREVAIKVLKGDMSNDPIALERFNREANTSTKLSHPNAVDVYDVGFDNNYHYIVMEYVKGHTLKQLLNRRGPIPFKEAVWIMKQLSSALLEAHKNGIIHRDIKSQNVLIKADGTVKLADFGIAVLANAMQLTSNGSVLGSVHYLAPELSKGGSATMQSDIYSLGIVFYELLIGDVPFKADTPIEVAVMHVRNDIPSVREKDPRIPQSVENIIIKATAKSLEDRYSNVALLLKDLYRCLSQEAINDKKLVLSNKTSSETNKELKIANKAKLAIKKEKEKKKDKIINTILITAVSMISILAVLLILFTTGIIGGKEDKYVTMPDLKGYTVTVAKDIIAPLSLSIDDSAIEWVLTDSTAAGIIVSHTPSENTSIEKGSKIYLTVSEGIYSKMLDFTGMHIDEAKSMLASKGFNIAVEEVDSDMPSGIIVDQDITKPGDKYDPNTLNKVKFIISSSKNLLIEFGYLGKDINVVYSEFTEKGVPVIKESIDFNNLTDNEKAYGENSVVRISPEEGSLYTFNEETPVVLYYYSK